MPSRRDEWEAHCPHGWEERRSLNAYAIVKTMRMRGHHTIAANGSAEACRTHAEKAVWATLWRQTATGGVCALPLRFPLRVVERCCRLAVAYRAPRWPANMATQEAPARLQRRLWSPV